MPEVPKAKRPFPALILDYLQERLSDDERYAVEQEWLRDPDTRTALEGLRHSGLSARELQDDFNEIRQSWHQQDGRVPSNNARHVSWIVIFVFVLLAGWSAWGYYQNQHPSPLYAEYFSSSTAQENYLAVRGTGTEEVVGLNSALTAYEQRAFKNSYQQFQALREAYPFNSTVLHYTALTAMQLEDYYAAEQALQQNLSISATPQERAAATWYLALTYLQLGEQSEAIQLLDTLINTKSGQYFERAKSLYSKL